MTLARKQKKEKVKQSLYGPGEYQKAGAPRFQDNQYIKVVGLSALCTGCLYSTGNIPGIHFCYRISWPCGPGVSPVNENFQWHHWESNLQPTGRKMENEKWFGFHPFEIIRWEEESGTPVIWVPFVLLGSEFRPSIKSPAACYLFSLSDKYINWKSDGWLSFTSTPQAHKQQLEPSD